MPYGLMVMVKNIKKVSASASVLQIGFGARYNHSCICVGIFNVKEVMDLGKNAEAIVDLDFRMQIHQEITKGALPFSGISRPRK